VARDAPLADGGDAESVALFLTRFPTQSFFPALPIFPFLI
jgi:hypothetical protein